MMTIRNANSKKPIVTVDDDGTLTFLDNAGNPVQYPEKVTVEDEEGADGSGSSGQV